MRRVLLSRGWTIVYAGLRVRACDSSDGNINQDTDLCCCFQERLGVFQELLRCCQERSVTDGSSNCLSMLIPGTLFVFRRVAELFLLRSILETTVRRRFDWDLNLAALPVPTLVY